MTKKKLIWLVGLALAPLYTHAADTDKPMTPRYGAILANNCFTCHGPAGRSPGEIPSVDRLSAADIATAVKQFRSGERASTVMGRHAKGYSDADIDAIANYIAGLNAKGGGK